MKKFWISLLVLLMVAGCSAPNNAEKKTLKVYNWGEYVDEAVLSDFENEYNAEVIYDTFDSNESLYTKLQTGVSYDILVPSDYTIQRLIEEDYLQEIDLSLIPNTEKLMEGTLNKAYDPEMKYSVPYFWGDFGIVYNKENVDPAEVEKLGWEILKDEKYQGQLYLYDSERDSFVPALKALGYSVNTENEAELNEAAEWLKEVNSKMNPVYAGDEVIDQMISESKDIALMYSGDAAYVMMENENLAYFVPKEGSNIWQDAMVIPKNAEQVELAHQFMNFMLEHDVALANTEYVGYRTVVQDVYDEVTGEGGTFEGNNAYAPDNNDKHEEFKYNAKTKEILSRLWTEIKVTH